MVVDIPEHITPRSLIEMSTDDMEKMLEGIRERRLKSVRQYEKAQAEKKAAADEKAHGQLYRQIEMAAKKLATIDKSLEDFEARILKIRALRLELGLE